MDKVNNLSLNELKDLLKEDNIKTKLDIKLIEVLFDILYKKGLINKKEHNLLITCLNHNIQGMFN